MGAYVYLSDAKRHVQQHAHVTLFFSLTHIILLCVSYMLLYPAQCKAITWSLLVSKVLIKKISALRVKGFLPTLC